MVALAPIEELKKKKAQLKKKQEELLDILKTKHSDFYQWMLENKIDPLDLKAYSAGLASAAAIAVAAASYQPEDQITTLTPQVNIIERQELVGKSDEEKATLVWERYGHIIERSATKYDLDPGLIFATIMIESGGNTYAKRYEPSINDASYGLGQLLFGTARLMGFEGAPDELYDPEVNIELIARYHARNNEVYGGLTPQELTTAYNTGNPYSYALPGHIDKFNKWFNVVKSFMG